MVFSTDTIVLARFVMGIGRSSSNYFSTTFALVLVTEVLSFFERGSSQ